MATLLSLIAGAAVAAFGFAALLIDVRDDQRYLRTRAALVGLGFAISGILAIIGNQISSVESRREELRRFQTVLKATNQLAPQDIQVRVTLHHFYESGSWDIDDNREVREDPQPISNTPFRLVLELSSDNSCESAILVGTDPVQSWTERWEEPRYTEPNDYAPTSLYYDEHLVFSRFSGDWGAFADPENLNKSNIKVSLQLEYEPDGRYRAWPEELEEWIPSLKDKGQSFLSDFREALGEVFDSEASFWVMSRVSRQEGDWEFIYLPIPVAAELKVECNGIILGQAQSWVTVLIREAAEGEVQFNDGIRAEFLAILDDPFPELSQYWSADPSPSNHLWIIGWFLVVLSLVLAVSAAGVGPDRRLSDDWRDLTRKCSRRSKLRG